MTDIFQKFAGSGFILIFFVFALIYLFVFEKRKPRRIMLVYVPVIVLLFFFNPLFFKVFYSLVGEEIYFRIIWLLPIATVIVYAIVHIADRLEGKKRVGFCAVAVVLLMVSGKLVYSSPLYGVAENQYHVPDEVVEICDLIELDGREVMAAFPREFVLYVRQYSATVCMPYGRDDMFNYYDEFSLLLDDVEIDVERMAELSKAEQCHYVILHEDKLLIGDPAEYDFEVFGKVNGYVIYRDTTMNFETHM